MRKRNQRQILRQRTRTTTRLLMVAGGLGISATLIVGWMVYLNIQDISKTRASANQLTSGTGGSTEEILCEFTWEKDPVLSATLGPDAISSSLDAHSTTGGRASTRGLSAGKNGKNIDLVLEESELFNREGIDISIDYRGSETDGYFISRGMPFYFGIERSKLAIGYRTENESGSAVSVKEVTDYEIIRDDQYRTYRFTYSPITGRAEITVNGAPVWSHQGKSNSPLYWKNGGHLMIGKNMNGDGRDMAILDNLVIRSFGTSSPLAESLLNFMLENSHNDIRVHFSFAQEERINSYTLERSNNGIDFIKIATLHPGEAQSNESEYIYTDPKPQNSTVLYYRIRQNLKNGKSISHPISAIKVNASKNLSIERVNPASFSQSFDVSYFVPKAGRVWIQLQDPNGEIASTSTYDAQPGKNVHVFRDSKGLQKGKYILNIMFDNKKVSTEVVKI